MGLRETDEHRKEQLKKCETIIRDAIRQPFGEAFALPVDPKQVPDYYELIKNPMDLQTIIHKIKGFEYSTVQELWQDCELMFSNCTEFNEDDSQVREDADELKSFLKVKLEEVAGKALE